MTPLYDHDSQKDKRQRVGWIAAALAGLLLLGGALSGNQSAPGTTSQSQSVTRDSVSAVASMTALEQMELVFVGGHTESQIEPVLRTAMSLYGLANTETNRRRAGDVLVTLRREYGQPEMVILDHMIRSHVSGVNIDFPDAAAISVAALVVGDR